LSAITFKVTHRHGSTRARVGELRTLHGVVQTPAFMPVGTYGVVRAVPAHILKEIGADIMLVNAYHLMLRPGLDLLGRHDGIHAFMGWKGPVLADSGGYQVFSLKDRVTISPEGCTFRDTLAGDLHTLTPEAVVTFLQTAGLDIGMVLDVCPPPDAGDQDQLRAMDLTKNWAERSINVWDPERMGLFGIVQGGGDLSRRERSASEIGSLGFSGHAIGGLGIGESPETTWSCVETCTGVLDEDRPRYLMGMGYPEDIERAVALGVDLFDCVLPTRNARNGQLFTSSGRINLKQARHLDQTGPPDPQCACPTCRHYSLGYLSYLYRIKDMGASILSSIHNLWYYLDFMKRLRHTIAFNLPIGGNCEPAQCPGTTDAADSHSSGLLLHSHSTHAEEAETAPGLSEKSEKG